MVTIFLPFAIFLYETDEDNNIVFLNNLVQSYFHCSYLLSNSCGSFSLSNICFMGFFKICRYSCINLCNRYFLSIKFECGFNSYSLIKIINYNLIGNIIHSLFNGINVIRRVVFFCIFCRSGKIFKNK